jgi:hypothetical protein
MKRLLILGLSLTLLTGCASTNNLSKYWPRSHDSDLAMMYVDAKMSVDDLDCKEIYGWDDASYLTRRMAEYSLFRQDPQSDNAKNAFDNLLKARVSENACDRYLNIVKLRFEVIAKSWGTR